MPRPARTRLINAARRSMLQRNALRRKLDTARDAFKPAALVGRAKYRVGETIDDAALATRERFRDHRLPITLAAAAGIAWLFREPIRKHVPRFGRKLRDLADGAIDRLRPATDDDHLAEEAEAELYVEEDDHEAPR